MFKVMTRFWPTLGIVCLLALAGYGLLNAMSGRMVDMQGQWLGNMPLDEGDDCRIRLFTVGRFDLECRGATTYAAKGTWRQEDDHLHLEFNLFAKDKKQVDPLPTPWVFRVKAGRNELSLGLPIDRGLPYRWKRGIP
jgi:hypothetical protein